MKTARNNIFQKSEARVTCAAASVFMLNHYFYGSYFPAGEY